MAHYFAYCYKGGAVGFCRMEQSVPITAKIFAEGEGQAFKDVVAVRCRRGYDGQTYLCPGLPEQDLNAFMRWHKWAFPGQSRFLDNFKAAA